mgnify:FL=1
MEDYTKEIDNIIDQGLNAKAYPGGQYALVFSNRLIIKHFGVRDYLHHEKTDGTEIYDVASLTKVISTSTVAHYLMYQGLFSLDTYIVEVLKDFPHQDIQVKDILAHTSGLPAYLANGNDLKTREEVIEVIKQTPLVYEKNTKVIYSCVGFIVLAHFMEKLTHKPINELAKTIVFDPLKMTDTSYRPDVNRAVVTEYRDDKVYQGFLKGIVHDGLAFAQQGLSGNAGLFSTVGDIAKFIQNLINDTFIYPKEIVDLMFESYIKRTEGDLILHRSLGWNKPDNDINEIIFHTGFTGCNIVIDRKRKMGFVLLTNAIHPKREQNDIFKYRNKISQILFG